MNQGLRFNKGKIRHELLPSYAVNEVAKIFTYGANKYTVKGPNGETIDGSDNWKKGMSWKSVVASLKRHISKFESGEDFDEESELLHLAHAATNCLFLIEYYKIAPQFDDRPHSYLSPKKIGLDIDGVIADFCTHFATYLGREPYTQNHWNDPFIRENFGVIADNKDFWLTMPVLTKSEDVPFEPACYITARSIDQDVTLKWLADNGFPTAPLYCIGHEQSKIEVAKNAGIDMFVDDKFENFVELNQNGVCTYLFDAPYNRKYNVGYKRVKSLKELV